MPITLSTRPEHTAIVERFTQFQAEARPSPPAGVDATAIAALLENFKRRQQLQRRQAWLRRTQSMLDTVPVAGRAARWCKRALALWRDKETPWRGKVLAMPMLGVIARWGIAFLRLGSFRTNTLRQHEHFQASLARIASNLQRHQQMGEAELKALQGKLSQLERQQQYMRELVDAMNARTLNSNDSLPPAVYIALEEEFRGDRADIQQRQASYLPHVAAAAAHLNLPVLDIGCGRGEWLEFLGRNGVTARGVDCNPDMVAECRKHGLDVLHQDGITTLQLASPHTLSGITVFHVVEHLTTGTLWNLLRAAQKALAPGGVLVLETPNPENLQVSGYSFYMDPSHLHPLPPPLLNFLVQQAGFETVELVRHAPWPEFAQEDNAYPPYLRKLLFCGQDYAIIAVRREEHPA